MKTEMRNQTPVILLRKRLSLSNLTRHHIMLVTAAALLGFSGLRLPNRCEAQDTPDTQTQAEDAEATPETERTERPRPVEQSRNSYLGRVLAKPMSHLGAPWLIRPEREEEERASESFKQLKLAEGMSVCDLGCGNGYWTLPMARDVGNDGKVYAVDIQREMLQKLRQRSSKYKLDNIEPVLGKVDDPNLPENKTDLVLLVHVYHEFAHPE